MSVVDFIVKNAQNPKAEAEAHENSVAYFDAMGKAAAHGYHDTFNELMNDMDIPTAVDVVKEAAGNVPAELHKQAEDILNKEVK